MRNINNENIFNFQSITSETFGDRPNRFLRYLAGESSV